MSNQGQFSEKEWDDLKNGMMAAFMAPIVIDFGILSFVKEMQTSIEYLVAAADKVDTELMKDLLKSLQKEQEEKDFEAEAEKMEEDVPTIDKVLNSVKKGLAVVDAKGDGAEAKEYREILYEGCAAVCKSAGGGFLGLGEEVSEVEEDLLKKLKKIMG